MVRQGKLLWSAGRPRPAVELVDGETPVPKTIRRAPQF